MGTHFSGNLQCYRRVLLTKIGNWLNSMTAEMQQKRADDKKVLDLLNNKAKPIFNAKKTHKQTKPKPKLSAFLQEQSFLNKWVEQQMAKWWTRTRVKIRLDSMVTNRNESSGFILQKVSHPQTFFWWHKKQMMCERLVRMEWNSIDSKNRNKKQTNVIQINQQNNKKSLNRVCTHTNTNVVINYQLVTREHRTVFFFRWQRYEHKNS